MMTLCVLIQVSNAPTTLTNTPSNQAGHLKQIPLPASNTKYAAPSNATDTKPGVEVASSAHSGLDHVLGLLLVTICDLSIKKNSGSIS